MWRTLSSKFDMKQKKLFRKLHLSIPSTYKISFSVSKRGGIVQLRQTLPISFLTKDQNKMICMDNHVINFIPLNLIFAIFQNPHMIHTTSWVASVTLTLLLIIWKEDLWSMWRTQQYNVGYEGSRILITYANIRFKGIKLITWLVTLATQEVVWIICGFWKILKIS
jgi:hypothetical protein